MNESHTDGCLLLAVLLGTVNAGVRVLCLGSNLQRRDIQGGGLMVGNLSSDRGLGVLAQLRKVRRTWWSSLAPEGWAWTPAGIRQ